MELKPRLSSVAKSALISVLCDDKNIDVIAVELGISRQGIAKNIRDIEILDMKLAGAVSSSTVFSTLSDRLSLEPKQSYGNSMKLLSDVCLALGGSVERRDLSGDMEFIFTLDDHIHVAYLNRVREGNDDPAWYMTTSLA
jgi:hypothetical protein